LRHGLDQWRQNFQGSYSSIASILRQESSMLFFSQKKNKG
jgi:hypothetical protein